VPYRDPILIEYRYLNALSIKKLKMDPGKVKGSRRAGPTRARQYGKVNDIFYI
jgi:hypothetical protein